MFSQHKHIGSVLLIGVIMCGIILYFGSKELIKLISEREEFLNTKISENIRDTLDNLMNVFLNNEVDGEVTKNRKLEKVAIDKLKWIMMVQNMVIFSSQIITLLTFSIGIYILYGLIANKTIKTTQGIVIIIILGQFLNNFLYVSSGFIHNVVYRLGVIEASKDYMEHIFGKKIKRDLKTGITDANITFKNVKFRYDKEKNEWLFEDLNVYFKAGESYALIGQSGGGKTTMMKMIAGLYVPEGGSIHIDNLNVKNADLEYLRENVNYFNQRTTLFNESIIYNMLYGNPDATEEQVMDILNKYDLLMVFADLPDGIQSNAGVQGGNLSGGMQRITMMMRGILKSSKIVVMDEPTTGLDADTTKNVADMIFKETEGKTLIIVTHSQVIKGMCNKVYDVSSLK